MDQDTTKGDPEQGLWWGFCNAGLGGLWNLSFGKTLDVYGEEAGCFSMLFWFLELRWTADSIFCWGQCSLGPLRHTLTEEACCPGIGRGDPKWARSCCGRTLGPALPGLGIQLA